MPAKKEGIKVSCMSVKFRLQVWYQGHVQGVGFRYKVAQIAKGFDVSGPVANLDDGRVHLVAVGEESEVREFAAQIALNMRDFIRSTAERADETSDRYAGFSIVL